MSCYYHPKVPTLTVCADCGHEICSTCSVDTVCPGCRLGRAMQSTAESRALQTATTERRTWTNGTTAQASPPPQPSRPPMVTVSEVRDEDRVLSALCYPLWPVALFLLALRNKVSPFVRYHAMQGVLVNALGVAAYFVYTAAASLPVIGWQSAVVLPVLLPAWFILNLYLGIRAYGGQMTRVPLAGDYADRFAGP